MGKELIQALGIHNLSSMTKRQVDIVLSLQDVISNIGDSWYIKQIPNHKFGGGSKETSSKLLLGKLRKRFFPSEK